MSFKNEAIRERARRKITIRHEVSPPSDFAFVETVCAKLASWKSTQTFPDGPALMVLDEQGPNAASSADGVVDLASFGPPEKHAVYVCDDLLKRCHRWRGFMTDAGRCHEAAITVQPSTRAYVLLDPERSQVVVLTADFCSPLALPFPSANNPVWDEQAFANYVDSFSESCLFDDPLCELIYDGQRIRRGGRDRYRDGLYLYLSNVMQTAGVHFRTEKHAVFAVQGDFGNGRRVAAAWAVGGHADRPWLWDRRHSERYVRSAASSPLVAGVDGARVMCITPVDGYPTEITDSDSRITLKHVA